MPTELQPLKDGVYRVTFPDGRPCVEYTIKAGRPQGLYRRWHANGRLAEECHYRNGLLHGLTKQWNDRGTLLGTSRFQNGTGLLCEWYANGQLKVEWAHYRGEWSGRMRLWGEDGMLNVQGFYFEGRPISKKRYLQQCEANSELPRFPEERLTNTLGNYVRRLRREKRQRARLGLTPEEIERQEAFDAECGSAVKKPKAQEAVSWLTEGARHPRELGELSRRKAVGLVKRLYTLGATEVWVTDIERDPDGAEYSKQLIIALPEDAEARAEICRRCADPARPFVGGNSPAIVLGKRFMSVFLM